MVVITFPDRKTEKAAIGILLEFSGKLVKTADGVECIVPEAAMSALAKHNLQFTVKGKANGSQVEAIRNTLSRPVQRRPRRSTKVAR